MMRIDDRMLVWVTASKAAVVEAMDVYWIEAEDGQTWIRQRGRERLQDHRGLAEVVEELADFGFMRVHRNHAVNLRRISEIRRRGPGTDWEVKLEPPVNRVLPVARGREKELFEAYSGTRR
jgi:DNA-binding LytR/AlgR family response regulator